jgi:hypothetical protein
VPVIGAYYVLFLWIVLHGYQPPAGLLPHHIELPIVIALPLIVPSHWCDTIYWTFCTRSINSFIDTCNNIQPCNYVTRHCDVADIVVGNVAFKYCDVLLIGSVYELYVDIFKASTILPISA